MVLGEIHLPSSAMSLPFPAMSVPSSAMSLPFPATFLPRFAMMVLCIWATGAGFSVLCCYLTSVIHYFSLLVSRNASGQAPKSNKRKGTLRPFPIAIGTARRPALRVMLNDAVLYWACAGFLLTGGGASPISMCCGLQFSSRLQLNRKRRLHNFSFAALVKISCWVALFGGGFGWVYRCQRAYVKIRNSGERDGRMWIRKEAKEGRLLCRLMRCNNHPRTFGQASSSPLFLWFKQ